MTRAIEAASGHDTANYTIDLLPGEGLWDARRRWEITTGRRGLVIVR